MIKNKEIRIAMIEADLKMCQVADKLGMYDVNFSRKLRYELSDSEKQRVLQAIEELKQGK